MTSLLLLLLSLLQTEKKDSCQWLKMPDDKLFKQSEQEL